jgi:Zn ribbon nucleic-acid-binding protein
MNNLVYLLADLRCSVCATLDALWLDPRRRVVECRECGSQAPVVVDSGGDR